MRSENQRVSEQSCVRMRGEGTKACDAPDALEAAHPRFLRDGTVVFAKKLQCRCSAVVTIAVPVDVGDQQFVGSPPPFVRSLAAHAPVHRGQSRGHNRNVCQVQHTRPNPARVLASSHKSLDTDDVPCDSPQHVRCNSRQSLLGALNRLSHKVEDGIASRHELFRG